MGSRIDRGTGVLAHLGETFGCTLGRRDVVAFQRCLQLIERALHLSLVGFGQLVGVLSQELLGAVHRSFAGVADIGLFTALAVLLGVHFRIAHHPLDVLLGQRGAAGDGHRLFFASAEVLCGDVHDAVGVDVESDLDLRHAARGGQQAREFEGTELLVVRGHFPLALVHLDLHAGLVVVSRGEDFAALGRDGGVALDQPRHHPALSLDAQAQRCHVEQQHVLDVAGEHTRLQAGADGHHLVGVHALVGLLAAGELLDQVGHRGHPGGSADEHHVVDVAQCHTSVLDHRGERRLAAVQQVGGELFELRPREAFVQVQRTVGAGGDVWQVDGRLSTRRQFDLGLLGSFP